MKTENKNKNSSSDMASSYKDRNRYLAELCVAGFIRILCLSNFTPEDIEQFCVLMYYELRDTWNVKISHPSFQYQMDNMIKKESYTDWYTAFGTDIICKGECKTWRIKALNEYIPGLRRSRRLLGGPIYQMVRYTPAVFIGIVDADNANKRIDQICIRQENSFGIYYYNGDRYYYNKNKGYKKYYNGVSINYAALSMRRDSIIGMKLDMSQDKLATLSFAIGEYDYSIAFSAEINTNLRYQMTISMYDAGQVQLLQ